MVVRKLQVFVSSTYNELIDKRQAIVDAILFQKEILLIILGVFAIVTLVILGKKRLKLKNIGIGPFYVEIKEVAVGSIELINTPIAGCSGEALTPPLKIRIQDDKGYPVKRKEVHLELYDEMGLLNSNYFIGQTRKVSDNDGEVEFNNLILKRTGRICILIHVDNHEKQTEDIDIFPPGLNIDFWNGRVGTLEYEIKFDRAMRMLGKR